MSSGTASSSYGYDGLGRLLTDTQTVSGHSYPFSYTHNLIDGVLSMTLPSGRVVNTSYDTAGRASSVTGTMSGVQTSYATGLQYAPQGALQQMSLGNGLVEQSCYNSLLQPTAIRQRRGGAGMHERGGR